MRAVAIPVLTSLIALAAPRVASGQAPRSSSDSAAVLGVVARFFDGMLRHDTTALRATLLPGAQFVVFVAGGAPGAPRRQTDSAFLASIAGRTTQRLYERLWTPAVLVHDGIATVWAPYDFHIDGAFSHCGIDSFNFVRTATGWQIAGIMYTVERTGCAPSPLGPPPPT
ncbi:MAG: nuclear transport factor 2 family protein [Gemmatimonadaceae bacterium]